MNLQFVPRTQLTVFPSRRPAGYCCLRAQNRWLFWESYYVRATQTRLRWVSYRWVRNVEDDYIQSVSKIFGQISRVICSHRKKKKITETYVWKLINFTLWHFTEELRDLYSLLNIVRVVKSRRMRWAEHVARLGEDRGVHRVLVGKPEGKRPLGRPRRRWEDNIKMDLQELGGVETGWSWLRIGKGGGHLWIR